MFVEAPTVITSTHVCRKVEISRAESFFDIVRERRWQTAIDIVRYRNIGDPAISSEEEYLFSKLTFAVP